MNILPTHVQCPFPLPQFHTTNGSKTDADLRAANKQVAQCEREVRAAEKAYRELCGTFRETKASRDVSIIFSKPEGTEEQRKGVKGEDDRGDLTLRVRWQCPLSSHTTSSARNLIGSFFLRSLHVLSVPHLIRLYIRYSVHRLFSWPAFSPLCFSPLSVLNISYPGDLQRFQGQLVSILRSARSRQVHLRLQAVAAAVILWCGHPTQRGGLE